MAIATKSNQENMLANAGLQEEKPQVLVVGPYASNYSFAKVNRGLALGLAQTAKSYSVRIWREPSVGLDYAPSEADLQKLPGLAEILTNNVEDTAITIYNSFTPDSEFYGLETLPGRIKLMYMAWEESVFPASRVTEMNKHLHGVMTASSFTKEILRRSGVQVPIVVVPNALDDKFLSYTPKPYPLKTKKKVKFLHISSARIRKGVDVMLRAYFNSFTADDDVVLIIKSFPGPDNTVNDQLGKLRKDYPNGPEVLHIFDPNLSEEELIDLTAMADACVYPTRAEGFGLPIAEAMFLKRPTIVTGYSGHMDFCDEDSALLVDYEIQDASDSEMVNIGAKWAEPDQKDLEAKLRYVYENIGSEKLKELGNEAYEYVEHLTWKDSAELAWEFIEEIQNYASLKSQKVAVMSEINTIGGIAEYCRDLYNSVQHSFNEFYFIGNSDAADRTRADAENVVRLWEQGSQDFSKIIGFLKEKQIDYLHIQHHSSYLPMSALAKLINTVAQLKSDTGIKILLTPHDTQSKGSDFSQIKTELKQVDHIFAHKQVDLDLFLKLGVSKEAVSLFPLPFDEYPLWSQSQLRSNMQLENNHPILVTHGIYSFHKGLLQTAEAVAQLKSEYPQILWLAVNAISPNNISSSDTFDQVQAKAKQLEIEENVRFFPDFLDSLEVMALLQVADIGLLVYDEVGESASAAVRKFLASGTTTIVTDIPMMTELNHQQEVYKITNNKPEQIAQGIKDLLTNPQLADDISTNALETSEAQSWEVMARRMLIMY